MASDERLYSDEEFALILRNAAELATRTGHAATASDGLTLAEMKSAAEQAGIDPMLVERAARLLVNKAQETGFERVIGGPLRHVHELNLPVAFDEEHGARLLAAVRINSDFHSAHPGSSSALGAVWRSSGEAGDVLNIVARPQGDDTFVSVNIDRRGTFALVCVMSIIAGFLSFVAATIAGSASPSLAPWTALAGIGGTAALARHFWSSSTRKARQKINTLMDVIQQTLDKPDTEAARTPAIGNGDKLQDHSQK